MKKLIAVSLMVMMLCGACAQADFKIGQAAEDAGNIELAFKYWMEAAEQGDAESAYALGRRYYYGEHVEQDYENAVKYFLIAAEQNLAKAQYAVGLCYENGRGVPQDMDKALEWYMKAALQFGWNKAELADKINGSAHKNIALDIEIKQDEAANRTNCINYCQVVVSVFKEITLMLIRENQKQYELNLGRRWRHYFRCQYSYSKAAFDASNSSNGMPFFSRR